MRKIGLFFKSMFSELGSGLSGPASVPFAVLALWVSGYLQKIAYGLLAAILWFYSAYRIWLKEHEEKLVEINKIREIEQKYFNERPILGLRVIGPVGREAWRQARERRPRFVIFMLHHLSGRPATSVYVDPIASIQKGYLLRCDGVSFASGGVPSELNYEVWEGETRPREREIEEIGWGVMLGLFFADVPLAQEEEANYPITVRFKDRDADRVQKFNLRHDLVRHVLSIEPGVDN